MARSPGFYFYTGDWMKAPDLSKCEPASRGVWIDLLCSMHEQDRSGQIVGTAEQLARISRCTVKQFCSAIDELRRSHTATVTLRDGVYTVTNRRMKRECNGRDETRKRVRNHRFRKKKGNGNGDVTPYSSLSVSSSAALTSLRSVRAAPPVAKSVSGEGEAARAKSRFSLDECRKYAESLKHAKAPAALARHLHETGEDDERIEKFLHPARPKPPKAPEPPEAADLERLADQLDRIEGQHETAQKLRDSVNAK